MDLAAGAKLDTMEWRARSPVQSSMEAAALGGASPSRRRSGGGRDRRMEVTAAARANPGDRGCGGSHGGQMAPWKPHIEWSRPCLLDRSGPRSQQSLDERTPYSKH
jgi:hypothetical protein